MTQGKGHLFRFAVTSQGEGDDWGLDEEPWTLQVRAYSLVEALKQAVLLTQLTGMRAWSQPDEEDEPDHPVPDEDG